MRFDPKADISTGHVTDAGGSSTSRGIPLPTQAGGGKLGLVIMVVGMLIRFWLSRRKSKLATR